MDLGPGLESDNDEITNQNINYQDRRQNQLRSRTLIPDQVQDPMSPIQARIRKLRPMLGERQEKVQGPVGLLERHRVICEGVLKTSKSSHSASHSVSHSAGHNSGNGSGNGHGHVSGSGGNGNGNKSGNVSGNNNGYSSSRESGSNSNGVTSGGTSSLRKSATSFTALFPPPATARRSPSREFDREKKGETSRYQSQSGNHSSGRKKDSLLRSSSASNILTTTNTNTNTVTVSPGKSLSPSKRIKDKDRVKRKQKRV